MNEENLHPSSTISADYAATHIDYRRLGYRKLELPLSSPPHTDSSLRRTYSEPLYSLGNIHYALSQIHTSPWSPPQENAVGYVGKETCPTLNDLTFIQRTVSDPNPIANPPVPVIGRTPPRPPRSRRDASTSCGEDDGSKRKKRMRERMQEMRDWCNIFMLENDLTTSESEINDGFVETELRVPNSPANHQEQSEESMGTRHESVCVEKKGSALSLHFKCPCGHGYEFLLDGKNCYYKLTDS